MTDVSLSCVFACVTIVCVNVFVHARSCLRVRVFICVCGIEKIERNRHTDNNRENEEGEKINLLLREDEEVGGCSYN